MAADQPWISFLRGLEFPPREFTSRVARRVKIFLFGSGAETCLPAGDKKHDQHCSGEYRRNGGKRLVDFFIDELDSFLQVVRDQPG